MHQNVEKGDIVQVQRKSYFICDQKTDTSLVLIEIPDGKESTAAAAATMAPTTTTAKKAKGGAKKSVILFA